MLDSLCSMRVSTQASVFHCGHPQLQSVGQAFFGRNSSRCILHWVGYLSGFVNSMFVTLLEGRSAIRDFHYTICMCKADYWTMDLGRPETEQPMLPQEGTCTLPTAEAPEGGTEGTPLMAGGGHPRLRPPCLEPTSPPRPLLSAADTASGFGQVGQSGSEGTG